MADGLKKNIDVLRKQAGDYRDELVNVVFPDIRDAVDDRDVQEVGHKLVAILEESIDKMPRWYTYGIMLWGLYAGVSYFL